MYESGNEVGGRKGGGKRGMVGREGSKGRGVEGGGRERWTVGDGGTGERHYTQNTSSPYIGEVWFG